MAITSSIISILIFAILRDIHAIVEPGYKDFSFDLTKNNIEPYSINFTKSMYKDTSISLKIECFGKPDSTFELSSLLVFDRCHQPDTSLTEPKKIQLPCHKALKIPNEYLEQIIAFDAQAVAPLLPEKRNNSATKNETKKKNKMLNIFPKTKVMALYRLKLTFKVLTGNETHFNVRIEAKRDGSYLSVLNWPLLPFYGIMSLVYLAFAIGWFIASCMNWRDLLRVQFWIGGVIAIGMFENALFYSEYQNINHHGLENGLLYFAEVVSCVKRALARILVIIVSMGFGIVKPRLGQMLHRVIAVGTIYFILAAIEGCIRVRDDRLSKTHMYVFVPLTVLDVGLCWWIFSSLVQTTRTLRIRKNVVKLTLYHHFTNTLIFTVLASLAYMAWTIKQTKMTDCINIGTIWLNDALWPFLFAVILAVTMVLWRPSNNNQRYAFTPLDLGDSEDDEDDMTLSDAFEGMKMRSKDGQNGSIPKSKKKAEDDLKWVEENIPSVPSTLLPTIDSDEEILTTKFEISKMD